MTQLSKNSPQDIAEKPLVLATDLDGTFLGGTEEERRMFYQWLGNNRSRVGLIFVTGRDPGFLRSLMRRGDVPKPDFVVGDVGTTIATVEDNHMLTPIEDLEAEIAEAWGDRGAQVQAALHRMPGLKLQSNAFRYRASYDMDPVRFDPRASEIVQDMGLDALISADQYFDVLPKGVSKGPSLLRLLTHLGIPNRNVLVAGDTLNDLSMFELGLNAVAVANSEPALIEKVTPMEHVYRAKARGTAGIAEAILAYEFLSKSAA